MRSVPHREPRRLGRYVLGERLGRGATAEVWSALDGEREVAIKWWYEASVGLERELRALSLLDLPGVVRLLDRGEHDGRPFAVTERVHGEPFPGPTANVESVLQATRRLLSALEGVHAVGVVHRDLKPSNVLVDDRGHVALLDFGLASGALLGATLSEGGQVAGTMRYMAPEQLLGQHADPRSDLYAVGVMVWEALAGGPLHGEDLAGLVHRRLAEPAPPLADVADVPSGVSRCVHALLQRDPAERPGRAAEALAQLSGRPLEGLPWLGSRQPIDDAVARLRAGRSCRVDGEPGSGVGRLLREIEAALLADHELRRLVPSERPLGSLGLGAGEGLNTWQALERAKDALTRSDGRPVVWLAHRLDDVDPWTRALLDEVDVAVLARAEPAHVRPPPLAPEDLMPLFGGCERVHRLRSDPAALLVARTQGRAGRIGAELSTWVARGLARTEPYAPHRFVPPPDTARVWVDRESLDRLQEEPIPAADAPKGLSRSMQEHLDWVAFVGPAATAEGIAQLRGLPTWEAELERDRLEALECLVVHQGAVQLLRGGRGVWAWSGERRQQAHRRVVAVLERGAAGRLRHLMVLGALDEAVVEAAVVVRGEHESGRTAKAFARAVSLLEVAGADGAAESLWLEALRAALSLRTKEAVGRLRRAAARQAPVDSALAEMVHAADDILGGRAPLGLKRLERMHVHPRETVEIERHGLMIMAAQRMAPEVQERMLAHAEVSLQGCARARARVWTWRGLMLHRWRRFGEARQAHERALALRTSTTGRLSSMLNAAAAALAEGHGDGARRLVQQAQALADGAGHRGYAARANAMERVLAHQRGAVEPDIAWAEAMHLDVAAVHVEAMIATRGRQPHHKQLAMASAEGWRRMDRAELALHSLAMAADSSVEVATISEQLVDHELRADVLQMLAAPQDSGPLIYRWVFT